ncbi:hypothetical protein HJB56_17895 [Rhizobium lentis]|uniref:hypothetical protein n=1 Tax=Rhizobium lentis TaxID=1138194 RepID=UPI001C82E445|nr:hypothetical protein [Rhizobium lentis]MBX5084618.1 hypothetical protein [Rhizobium lentis]MBX5096783.1 hypothetical protein [Rhizobium lentis]MBX5121755.1 hypothetical protein [Rhizobium lentis]
MSDTKTEEQAVPATASRPFDVHRWSDYPELRNCLTELVRELEDLESRGRQRGEGERKKFREAVRALVLDLYVAWKAEPNLLVGISLANRSYTTKSRYRALFIQWSSFKAAYDLLLRAGYIAEVQRGFHDPRTGIGRNTRIKATQQLIDLLSGRARLTLPDISIRNEGSETIELRDSDKRRIDYKDTDDTLSMRSALGRINAHLQGQWLDLRITDEEYASLQSRMMRDYDQDNREYPVIDLTRRALVRIFNNEDWQQGGRFYRGWWQSIPKEYRNRITINDKRTCEVDYSTLHPVLLYARFGQRLVGDAYSIEAPNVPRALIKQTFNKMINALGRINRPHDFSEEQIGMSWDQLQAAIAERHAPIKQSFNSGYGLRLQRLDSDLAQRIMLRFIDSGHTCLPVHDSFIVHHALADKLKTIMVDEFTAMTGQTITVKSLDGFQPELESDYEPVTHNMIPDDSWFHGTGEYTGYEQRRLDWYSKREGGETA